MHSPPKVRGERPHEHPRISGQGGAEGIRRAGVAAAFAVLTAEEAEAAAKQLGGPALGGEEPDPRRRPRQGQFKEASAGDKGGVRLAKSVDEVKQFAKRDARRDAGHRCRPARPASRSTASTSRTAPTSTSEFYLSLLVDRETSRVAFVVSTEGGMDIEEVAHDTPEKIVTVLGRSGHRRHGPSRPHGRAGAGPDRRPRQAGRES